MIADLERDKQGGEELQDKAGDYEEDGNIIGQLKHQL